MVLKSEDRNIREGKPGQWSQPWAAILFNSHVTQNRSLNLSDLSFSISETGIIISTLQGCMRIKRDHIRKALDTVPGTEDVSNRSLCSWEVLLTRAADIQTCITKICVRKERKGNGGEVPFPDPFPLTFGTYLCSQKKLPMSIPALDPGGSKVHATNAG